MKISRVNHIKSGVSIKEGYAKGILYKNPQKDSEDTLDLMKHVTGLNRKAQKMYSFFNWIAVNAQKERAQREEWKKIALMSNELKRRVFFDAAGSSFKQDDIEFQLKKLDQWIVGCSLKSGITEAEIDQMVDNCLRASLKKYIRQNDSSEKMYVPDLMKKLFKSAIRPDASDKENLTKEEKKSLLTVLNEDYRKDKELKKIVHSIEMQNVRVKSTEKDGSLLLCLSNSDHPQKKQIFQFLQKFAAAEDEEARINLFRHFKQLLLLYYCGKEKYKVSFDQPVPVWNWEGVWEDEAENFDALAYEWLCEIDSLKEKRAVETKAGNFTNAGWISNEIKKSREKIRNRLRDKITECYREAVNSEDVTSEDIYWLQYIQRTAEKFLLGKSVTDLVKMSVFYLCEHTYREWLSYICMKYIDMGKGVYHFAVPKDMSKVISGEEAIGEVLPEYRVGISSFDYERIKAEETVNRELSFYVSFAVNSFTGSVFSSDIRKESKFEDILSVENAKIKQKMYADADRRILRYFGGKSTWSREELEGISAIDLVLALKEGITAVRNQNFHYTTSFACEPGKHNDVLYRLFQGEYKKTGRVYRKKYFSNNTWMFYTENDISNLLNRLYFKKYIRSVLIPSFQKIINKKKLDDIITVIISEDNRKRLQLGEDGPERMEKFRSMLYFVLKEIYYSGFLQEENVKDIFLAAMEDNTDAENPEAFLSFRKRLNEIIRQNTRITFGKICQQIMLDYNQQNQDTQKVIGAKEVQNQELYKHFRMLLYLYIRKAFLEYIKRNACYRFLQKPDYEKAMAEKTEESSFCASWQPHLYHDLKEKMKNPLLLSWYAVSHFLNQKQLNGLIGCIKNHIQYLRDINGRSLDTKNPVGENTETIIWQYREILSVLDFSKLFCGSVTNCFEDYFKDEEDYAEHLANYVDFERKGQKNIAALQEFCSQSVTENPARNIGLYYDTTNPIVNRNILYAGMYGNEKLFRNCFKKVSEQEIQEYYRDKAELTEVFKNGKCKNIEEEKQLRRFQSRKNHIELTEITIYSEIVNDLIGQLISWSYLRERDLMYYQLGFYYMRLFYGGQVEESSPLRRLEGDGIHIRDGAILYQIIAMYTYDLPIINRDAQGRGVIGKKAASNGQGVRLFCNDYCKDKGEIYEAGLCIFENVKTEHDEMVNLRDYIDHFKYYSLMSRSILELYSDVYDRYFNYDIKLKKSVTVILQNILLRNFVDARIEMQKEDSVRYTKSSNNVQIKRNAARLCLNKPLNSVEFHVSQALREQIKQDKRKNKIKMTIPVRNEIFLEQLAEILEYKE